MRRPRNRTQSLRSSRGRGVSRTASGATLRVVSPCCVNALFRPRREYTTIEDVRRGRSGTRIRSMTPRCEDCRHANPGGWARGESNSHGFPHRILNPARLPVPPRAPSTDYTEEGTPIPQICWSDPTAGGGRKVSASQSGQRFLRRTRLAILASWRFDRRFSPTAPTAVRSENSRKSDRAHYNTIPPKRRGEVPERPIGRASKARDLVRGPWVRIPPSPPYLTKWV